MLRGQGWIHKKMKPGRIDVSGKAGKSPAPSASVLPVLDQKRENLCRRSLRLLDADNGANPLIARTIEQRINERDEHTVVRPEPDPVAHNKANSPMTTGCSMSINGDVATAREPTASSPQQPP